MIHDQMAMRSSVTFAGLRMRDQGYDLSSVRLGEDVITERQAMILSLAVDGAEDRLIARQLNYSLRTVEREIAALMRMLQAASRTQLGWSLARAVFTNRTQ